LFLQHYNLLKEKAETSGKVNDELASENVQLKEDYLANKNKIEELEQEIVVLKESINNNSPADNSLIEANEKVLQENEELRNKYQELVDSMGEGATPQNNDILEKVKELAKGHGFISRQELKELVNVE
jgi:hypothetical protein